jgi:hypothetical protein
MFTKAERVMHLSYNMSENEMESKALLPDLQEFSLIILLTTVKTT